MLTTVALGGVALVLAGLTWGKRLFPDGPTSDSLSSVFASSLLGSDTRESVETDLNSLRTQIEEIGRSIPSGDQSEASANRLMAELPKFHSLFRRACRLPVKSVTLEDFASDRKKTSEMLERLRSETPSGHPAELPFSANFWHINTATKPDERVAHAINEITVASNSVSSILSQALVEYPDPLTDQCTDFDWSDEDRRVLAIIRLQGGIERDALRALAAIDPKATSPSDLTTVHMAIDQAVQSALALSKLPGKSVGGMLAFVPKGNPYEPQQVSAMVGMNELHKLMEAEAALPAEVNYLFDDVKALSKVTEEIIYGSGSTSLATYLATASTSTERYKAFVAAAEKQKSDALQAEIDRKAKEQQQLADAQLRKQQADEEQRKQEEERQRALKERMADAGSGNPGGRLGASLGGPRGQDDSNGRRPGPIGIPTGPNGLPIGASRDGQPLGQPPNFPSFGPRSPEMGQDRFRPPVVPQGDPAKLVTITCAQVKNQDSSAYLRSLPQWIFQYSPSISVSNGDLKITLQNYDKPLADLRQCFPMLVFESFDAESRTIIAKEK